MRPFTALVILAVWQCLHAYQHLNNTPRYLLHELLGTPNEPVRRIVKCARTLGVSKCLSALGVWRAENAIRTLQKDSGARFSLTKDIENFSWKRYINYTDEDLNTKLLDNTEELLRYRALNFNIIPGYAAKLSSKNNGSVIFNILQTDEVEGRGTMKKLRKEFYRFTPILLAPGLIVSALMPFMLPSLKMMILLVGFMNQIALIGAIFTVMRNNAFNDQPNDKVIYVNSGYDNEKLKFAATNNDEHVHTDHLGILYDDSQQRRPFEQQPFEETGEENIEELPQLSVNPQWIKEYTDNKMMQILKDRPNNEYFYN